MTDAAFDDWVQRARDADIEGVALSLGARLRRNGREHTGPCPRCNGKDRFSINTQKRIFNCRGAEGGDVIKMVMHVRECEFVAACEFINGDPPPKGESRQRDPAIERERREERRDNQLEREQEQAEERKEKQVKAADVWAMGRPIRGTHGDHYFRARGILLLAEHCEDLRFCEALPYVGFRSPEEERPEELGKYPAVLAAIRNARGELQGVHRIYLDREMPRKLKPPGDPERNAAKKAFGLVGGGIVRLSPLRAVTAIGEGIETTLAWAALADLDRLLAEAGLEVKVEDVGLAAAVSLGNLSGSAEGTLPHPKYPSRSIPNGVPDMDRPGMVLPDEIGVPILLGDGDSDPATTRGHLLTAARRFAAQGRQPLVSFAWSDADMNDILIDQQKEAP